MNRAITIENGRALVTETVPVSLAAHDGGEKNASAAILVEEAVAAGLAPVTKVRLAALHEGVTRNKTFYSAAALERALHTWTAPTSKPVLTDHMHLASNIIGRVESAAMGFDGGRAAMMLTASIIDPEAQQRVLSGLWSEVSIGAAAKTAACSVCGADWAKGDDCDHVPGRLYQRDDGTEVECVAMIDDIEFREVSFVAIPSDSEAGVRAVVQDAEAAEAAELSWALSVDDGYGDAFAVAESADGGAAHEAETADDGADGPGTDDGVEEADDGGAEDGPAEGAGDTEAETEASEEMADGQEEGVVQEEGDTLMRSIDERLGAILAALTRIEGALVAEASDESAESEPSEDAGQAEDAGPEASEEHDGGDGDAADEATADAEESADDDPTTAIEAVKSMESPILQAPTPKTLKARVRTEQRTGRAEAAIVLSDDDGTTVIVRPKI